MTLVFKAEYFIPIPKFKPVCWKAGGVWVCSFSRLSKHLGFGITPMDAYRDLNRNIDSCF